MSFVMANPDISRKLLKIFEGLVNSCCQHYQMLSKKDQLEADQIVRNAFPCLKLKQEDAIKEEREYFEDDGDLKVKEEARFTEITEDHQTSGTDAETFQKLDLRDLDTEGSSEDEIIENKNHLKRTFMESDDHFCKRLKASNPLDSPRPTISDGLEPPQDLLSSHLQTIVKTIVKSTMEEKTLKRSKSEESEMVRSTPFGRRNSWSGSSCEETNLNVFNLSSGNMCLPGDNSGPWYQDIDCEKLTLTTRGPSVTAEFFGSCIGRFIPMERTPNCFIQKHSKTGRKLIMMRTPLTSFRKWLWTVRFEKDYMPVFQNVTDSRSVPLEGWQWWDLKLSSWKNDLSLTMEAFSPCGIITITVKGAATEILPEKSVFKPKQGEWFSGRQV